MLAERALQNDELDVSSSISLYLDETLKELDAQSKKTALLATNKVKGEWFFKKFLFTKIKKKNFDIGLDDGFVTPSLVPDMPVCENTEAKSLAIPGLDSINKYGFSVKLEIEPREWEKNKILRIAFPQKESRAKRIEPAIHFPVIMNYIKSDAISRGGFILQEDNNQSVM